MKLKNLAIALTLSLAALGSINAFAATNQSGQPQTTSGQTTQETQTQTLAPTANGQASQMSATQTSFTPGQTKAIENIVRQYLIQNPQVMVEVMQALQQQQQAKMQQQVKLAIKQNAKQLFNDTNSPVAGNPEGTITLVEFFDYQCPHCRRIAPVIDELIKNNPELKVVYKSLAIFPGSTFINKASVAAAKQGKYQAFHQALMQAKGPLNKQTVLNIAKKVGINVKQLQTDMKSDAVKNELQNNLDLAGPDALNLVGTPAFVIAVNINNPEQMHSYFIPGQVPKAVLQKVIDQAKANSKSNSTASTTTQQNN